MGINASWFWLFTCLLCFIYLFFKKQKIMDFEKASWPTIGNIAFLFLLKVGLVGPVNQQI